MKDEEHNQANNINLKLRKKFHDKGLIMIAEKRGGEIIVSVHEEEQMKCFVINEKDYINHKYTDIIYHLMLKLDHVGVKR